jgi:hypothetical protein
MPSLVWIISDSNEVIKGLEQFRFFFVIPAVVTPGGGWRISG